MTIAEDACVITGGVGPGDAAAYAIRVALGELGRRVEFPDHPERLRSEAGTAKLRTRRLLTRRLLAARSCRIHMIVDIVTG